MNHREPEKQSVSKALRGRECGRQQHSLRLDNRFFPSLREHGELGG